MLYPSQFLARIVDPVTNLRDKSSLSELRSRTAKKIREHLELLPSKEWIDPDRPSDRWYWAAPLLLDRASPATFDAAERWFQNHDTWKQNADETNEEETSGAKREHLEFFYFCFHDPSRIELGRMPRDLPEVLADLALGSPAVLALRALTRQFPEDAPDLQVLRSFRIAEQFLSLFNKPESIAAVRLSEGHAHYWAMVLDYCASGCLQSVLDEYFHLLPDRTPIQTRQACSCSRRSISRP